MAKTKISEFSATPANNTDIDSINIAEGCAPSGINDAIRELMAQLKDFQTGAVGDSFNGPVGTTTAAAGAFTTLSASSTVSGTGFSTYLASPPAIGGTAAAAGSFTTLSASGNVTLSGGTANGVAYLNGSKVVTSGSALTFDGTKLTSSASGAISGVFNRNTSSGATLDIQVVGGSVGTLGSDSGGNGRFDIAAGTSLQLRATGASGFISFDANNSEAMRLTSTGLGIGTSSPSYKLDVRGTNDQYIQILTSSTGGYAAGLRMKSTGSGEYGVFSDSSLRFYDFTASATRLTIDSSGNLGLGVTPSAWSSPDFRGLQVGSGIAVYGRGSGDADRGGMAANAYNDGSWKYIATGNATRAEQSDGSHAWYTAASGTAGNAITFTQAMTLDASGQLGIGTTSPAFKLDVDKGSSGFVARFKGGTRSAYVYSDNDAVYFTSDTSVATAFGLNEVNDYLNFYTGNAERARIDSSGNLLVGTSSTSASSNAGAKIYPAGTMRCVNADSTNSSENWSMYSTGAANYRFYVGWGGTVYATSTTITAISDQRLKENIRDLDDGLDIVMALKPRKFDWKEGKGANIKNARGFIAQEFETVLPDMIETWRDPAPEGEEPYKAINANLIPTLVKAIQEQQAIIESLKARLDAANL
jgi:hypothetical protein